MKVLSLTRLKLAALNHSANSLIILLINIQIVSIIIIIQNYIYIYIYNLYYFIKMILQWLEHWTYPYQEHTLPVKLKNQIKNYLKHIISRALRLELRNIRLKLTVLPIKLCSSEKRWLEHLSVKTQYLANILPYL